MHNQTHGERNNLVVLETNDVRVWKIKNVTRDAVYEIGGSQEGFIPKFKRHGSLG